MIDPPSFDLVFCQLLLRSFPTIDQVAFILRLQYLRRRIAAMSRYGRIVSKYGY